MKTLTTYVVLILCILTNAQAQDELHDACLKCDLEGAKSAILNGADVNKPHTASGQSTLAYSYHCPEVTSYLLEQGGDPNGGNYPALVSASTIAQLEVINLLLANGADPNSMGGGEPALFKIVQMTNCAECADVLLTGGADKTTKGGIYEDLFRVFAIFGASQDGRLETMKAYGDILKSYNVGIPDSYYTPSDVINAPPAEMANVLIKHGIDPNVKGYDKDRPIDIAQKGLKAAPKRRNPVNKKLLML